jgi:hypothetical protein
MTLAFGLAVVAVVWLGKRMPVDQTSERAGRRSAPKLASIPSGDRPAYSTDEGQT